MKTQPSTCAKLKLIQTPTCFARSHENKYVFALDTERQSRFKRGLLLSYWLSANEGAPHMWSVSWDDPAFSGWPMTCSVSAYVVNPGLLAQHMHTRAIACAHR